MQNVRDQTVQPVEAASQNRLSETELHLPGVALCECFFPLKEMASIFSTGPGQPFSCHYETILKNNTAASMETRKGIVFFCCYHHVCGGGIPVEAQRVPQCHLRRNHKGFGEALLSWEWASLHSHGTSKEFAIMLMWGWQGLAPQEAD